jgi:hypothetical protein
MESTKAFDGTLYCREMGMKNFLKSANSLDGTANHFRKVYRFLRPH